MIAQFCFFTVLQTTGTLFTLLFRKRLPLTFLLFSAFLWGSLSWVFCSLCILILRLPYTKTSIGLLLLVLLSAFLVINFRQKNFQFTPQEKVFLAVWAFGSFIVFTLLSIYNLTFISPDSLHMILNGRAFADQGFSPFIRSQLTLRGVFVPAFQAAGPLLGLDYLYGIQPVMIFDAAVMFLYFGWRMLKNINPGKALAWMPVVMFIGMVSSYYLPFQAFYIHTNLLSGIYLMVAIGCFWLALVEKNYAWLVFGVLALSAFGLLRTESPLFGLLFLTLLISHPELPYRVRLAVCLPFTITFAGWFIYLFFSVTDETYILDSSNILIILTALVGFSLLVIGTGWKWIRNNLLPRLPWLLLVASFCVCIVLFALDPDRMRGFLNAMLLNISEYGLWGMGWFIATAGLLLASALPSLPYERFFSVGIPTFLVFLYAISTRNVSYQLDWGDSANRMLTHIFPTLYLYLSVKFGRGPYSIEEKNLFHPYQPYIVGAIGFGLMILALIIIAR